MTSDAATRIARSGQFGLDDIELICQVYAQHGAAPDSPWDGFRHAHLVLPEWFQRGLDPLGEAYAAQQHRLWGLLAGVGRPYDPDVDEKEAPWGDVDPVRQPGFYTRRDAQAVSSAGDHIVATGMLLKHAGLKPGDRALEYGAGFAQSALAMARLGVQVDTVDISSTFCEFVRRQAEFFQVPLHPHHARFGHHPRPGERYKLIWFYESFHHSVNFREVVDRLQGMLADDGKVILGGEPIVTEEYAAVPYPWGVRLQSEVVAVMRQMHWFELGFSEDFIFDLFTNAGFRMSVVECEPTLFGRLYVFDKRPAETHLGQQWLPPVLAREWHGPEADGRWTAGRARLPVDARPGYATIELDVANLLRRRQRLTVEFGDERQEHELAAGERRTLKLRAQAGVRAIRLESPTIVPALVGWLRSRDRRKLGVFVRRLRYR